MASAIKARRELPQPRPRALYICWPAKGSRAPTRERSTVFAASAEAACTVNASTR